MPNAFALPREALKVPLVLLIYLFLLQYFTYNSAEPETGEEGEQRKRN